MLTTSGLLARCLHLGGLSLSLHLAAGSPLSRLLSLGKQFQTTHEQSATDSTLLCIPAVPTAPSVLEATCLGPPVSVHLTVSSQGRRSMSSGFCSASFEHRTSAACGNPAFLQGLTGHLLVHHQARRVGRQIPSPPLQTGSEHSDVFVNERAFRRPHFLLRAC